MGDTFTATCRKVARGLRLFWEFDDGTVLPVVRGGDGDEAELDALLTQASDTALAEVDDVEALGELEAQLEAAAEAIAGEPVTDDGNADLDRIATAIEAVRARAAAVGAENEERAANATALLERIRGPQASDTDPDGDPADPAAPEEETEDEPAAPAPEEEPEPAPEAVAAAAAPAPAAPRIGRVAARRPAGLPQTRADLTPRVADLPANVADWGLVASAEGDGIAPGQAVRTREQLASLWMSQLDASMGYRGPRTKFPAVRMGNPDAEQLYGRDRFLGNDSIANARTIARVLGDNQPGSIQAAGGPCAPAQVNYDMPVIGTDARPVRNDLMVRFGADRGGIRTFPVPTLDLIEDLAPAAVDQWTTANDITPSDPTTKPCAVMTCPDEDNTDVYAVTKCLEVGEFRRRFFMEQVEAWMRLIAIHHARTAENFLLTAIGDGSTDVDVGQGLGATRDLLGALDRALAAFVSRHRAPGTTWRWGAPFWLLSMIRTDLAREMPGSADERLAMADAAILAIFRVHGVTPTFFLDGEAGQIFGPQGDGPLLGWPSTVVTYLYPEGTWLFLDGGTYEAGWFRDSGLIETNDARFFSETFEGAHMHGPESYRITHDVCPDGTTSGTVDFDPCATGS